MPVASKVFVVERMSFLKRGLKSAEIAPEFIRFFKYLFEAFFGIMVAIFVKVMLDALISTSRRMPKREK